jgi:hypothetical protein
MDILDEEIIGLFKALNEYSVKYILVGGFAVVLNGSSRLTEDVDVWIEDTAENRRNLNKALRYIDLPEIPQIETFDFLPGWSGFPLSSGFSLDILTSLKGFKKDRFDECYKLSNEVFVENIPIRFLHINQLIEEKKATNRLKDQVDIEDLEKIRKKKGL